MSRRLLMVFCTLFTVQPFSMLNATEIGQVAPKCKLAAFDTKQAYDLQQYQGKVIYIDFWASWCPPCVKSFPFLNELERDFSDKGLKVIAVNLDEEIKDAQVFLQKYPAQFAVALDSSNQCAQDFNVAGMPSSYLIDHKGIVRYVAMGYKPETADTLRKLVGQLLKESGEKK